MNRLEMLNAIPLLDIGETITFNFDKINYEFIYENDSGTIDGTGYSGDMYTVKIGDQERKMLVPKTEGNDVPMICFGKIKETDLPKDVERAYDSEGNVWVIANQHNFNKISSHYGSDYAKRAEFWQLNKTFIIGAR